MSDRTTLPCSMPGSSSRRRTAACPDLVDEVVMRGCCPTTRNAPAGRGAAVLGMAAGSAPRLFAAWSSTASTILRSRCSGTGCRRARGGSPRRDGVRVALGERRRRSAACRACRSRTARRRARGSTAAAGGAPPPGRPGPRTVTTSWPSAWTARQAGADRLAVQQHGAGPAHPLAAAVPDSGRPRSSRSTSSEAVVRRHPCLDVSAVDRERHERPGLAAHAARPLRRGPRRRLGERPPASTAGELAPVGRRRVDVVVGGRARRPAAATARARLVGAASEQAAQSSAGGEASGRSADAADATSRASPTAPSRRADHGAATPTMAKSPGAAAELHERRAAAPARGAGTRDRGDELVRGRATS